MVASSAYESAVRHATTALAERHGVPVLVHCEVTRLRELEALLAEFPRVTVVWAHGGYTPLVLARRRQH